MVRQHEIKWAAIRDAAPSVEPITVAEAKTQARVQISDDDTWFGTAISAARRYAEDVALWRTLVTTSWTMVLDRFPTEILLPFPPALTVESVNYYDTDGVQQPLVVNTDFTLDIINEPARIRPAFGTVWPATRAMMNAVEVKFTAGYGATGSSVPAPIRQAIAMMVADAYENRETSISGTIISKIPFAAETLLAGFSMKGFV